MTMDLRGLRSRRGAILSPIIGLMTLLVFMIGLLLLNMLRDMVLEARATAVAEATALSALRVLRSHDPAVGSQPMPSREAVWQHLSEIAAGNGFAARYMRPLAQDDVTVGPTWAKVTVRMRRGRTPAYTAVAEGVPADRIAPGRVECDANGSPVRAVGCLPLGVALSALPDHADPTPFWVDLRGDAPAVHCVRLPGSEADPEAHLRFLSCKPFAPVEGAPPPAVQVGDGVENLSTSDEFLRLVGERLSGRVVIAPLTENGRVAAFGRLKIEQVDTDKGAIQLSLAPSAVSRMAGASESRDVGTAPGPQMRAVALGQVLRARLRS